MQPAGSPFPRWLLHAELVTSKAGKAGQEKERQRPVCTGFLLAGWLWAIADLTALLSHLSMWLKSLDICSLNSSVYRPGLAEGRNDASPESCSGSMLISHSKT